MDRPALDGIGDWLRPVPWQWFVTLTFPWNVERQQAHQLRLQWVNLLERALKTQICAFYGMERKSVAAGIGVSWHFHLLVAARFQIPKELLEDTWTKLVGHGIRRMIDDRLVSDSVKVDLYDPLKKGPEYCAKMMNDSDCEWDLDGLELFGLYHQQDVPLNSRQRRGQRRLLARCEAA